MIALLTSSTDTSKAKLPADAMPAVFALSVNRKLRYLYEGPYFRFSRNGQEYDYPETPAQEGDKIVKIYDQKAHNGHTSYDAIQTDPDLQPTVGLDNGVPFAKFDLGQYMTIGVASQLTRTDFTITIKGSSSHPRPLFGCWGADTLSVEPGQQHGRYKLNNKQVVLTDSNNRMTQIFAGVDKAQNNTRVLEAKSNTSEGAAPLPLEFTSFDNVAIGRIDTRYFSGTFSEVTYHDNLTELASNRIWEGSKNV